MANTFYSEVLTDYTLAKYPAQYESVNQAINAILMPYIKDFRTYSCEDKLTLLITFYIKNLQIRTKVNIAIVSFDNIKVKDEKLQASILELCLTIEKLTGDKYLLLPDIIYYIIKDKDFDILIYQIMEEVVLYNDPEDTSEKYPQIVVPGPVLAKTLPHFSMEENTEEVFPEHWKLIQADGYDPKAHKRSFTSGEVTIILNYNQIDLILFDTKLMSANSFTIEQLISILHYACCEDNEQLYCLSRGQIQNIHTLYHDDDSEDYIPTSEWELYEIHKTSLHTNCEVLRCYIQAQTEHNNKLIE